MAEDQSTYVLRYSEASEWDDVTKAIEEWSTQRDGQISKEDFVQLFYLAPVQVNDKNVTKIASKYLKFNPTTGGCNRIIAAQSRQVLRAICGSNDGRCLRYPTKLQVRLSTIVHII